MSFLKRHWRLVGYVVLWLLLGIVVLQNLEPTHLDVLFWSFGSVPKLVLVLASMGVGVLLWELGRFQITISRKRSSRPSA